MNTQPVDQEQYFIHVGLPKTGSTFLQKRFFSSLPEIECCHNEGTKILFFKYFYSVGDFEFNPSYAYKLLRKEIGKTHLRKSPTKNIISDEGFSGTPWGGSVLRKRNYKRLKAVFENPHVIIVLRNQRTMIQSLYLHYVMHGGTISWRSFLRRFKRSKLWDADYMKYGHYVRYLFDTFGKKNVSVLFYEDLKKRPEEYLDQWCDILGINRSSWNRAVLQQSEKVSMKPAFLAPMRFINKFTSSSKHPHLLFSTSLQRASREVFLFCSNKLLRGTSKKAVPDEAAEQFLEHCHESNRLLKALVDRDLSEYGYPGI